MELEAIREAVHRQPFQPFALRLADGRQLLVPHPDFIAVPPVGRRVAVFDHAGALSILEPLLIVSIDFAQTSPSPN